MSLQIKIRKSQKKNSSAYMLAMLEERAFIDKNGNYFNLPEDLPFAALPAGYREKTRGISPMVNFYDSEEVQEEARENLRRFKRMYAYEQEFGIDDPNFDSIEARMMEP